MISMIVPFYNESSRFLDFKIKMNSYLKTNKWIKELLLVDDGSIDDTKELLRLYSIELNTNIICKVLHIQNNVGKGSAIKSAVFEATQNWILCNDADLSYHPNQIDVWVDNNWINFQNINTLYFGSRTKGNLLYKQKLFYHRIFIGRIYSLLIKCVLGLNVPDTQCGFKLYPRVLARKIFLNVTENRFAFDIDVIAFSYKHSIKVDYLPVYCVETAGSKVNLIYDSWDMFKALFRIRKKYSC
ncbi:MAG: glycosyltransferase [Bacteroidia bacterium]|nr:glycosyltransferase [Bacteroidia bacterium]